MNKKLAYALSALILFVIFVLVARFLFQFDWSDALGFSAVGTVADIVVDALFHRNIFSRDTDEE